MKTILCYGDSNTWGFDYETQGRFPYEVRWPNVMQKILGGGFHVIEEGLAGRTTALDDPDDESPEAKNGLKYLNPCLRSHFPLDLILFMLGTNDLKMKFFTSARMVAKNAERLIEKSREELCRWQGYKPQILLIAPAVIGDTIEKSMFGPMFCGNRSILASMELTDELCKTAERLSCHFLNAAQIVKPNDVDAIHLTREGHRQLGKATARKVQEIFA